MSYVDFSSWPREQEQTFVVYEARAAESQKQAMTLAIIVAAIVFVFALAVYAGVEPDKADYGKDMNLRNLTRKESAPGAATQPPKAEPAKAETAPAETAPAETQKVETPVETPAEPPKAEAPAN